MKDPYGREITNIRITLTQECNLDCFYCHQEGEKNPQDRSRLDTEEVRKILETAFSLGMEKVKFSGGEPLLHPDIIEMIETASDIGMKDISLTTNGVSLEEKASELVEAGLDRVNVSLDTIDPEVYEEITGRREVEIVKRGIKKARSAGLFPVKINMLLMKGINDDLIEKMIEFASEAGAILQIIELTADQEDIKKEFYEEYHLPLEDIAGELEERAVEIKERRMHARKKYFLKEPETQVELVRTMHNTEFCANCTRLRVTSSAELKPCLLRTDNHVPLREDLKNGNNIKEKFIEAINRREPYWS